MRLLALEEGSGGFKLTARPTDDLRGSAKVTFIERAEVHVTVTSEGTAGRLVGPAPELRATKTAYVAERISCWFS